MAHWKPLPADLGPQARALAVRLRELKDQTEITTAGLARKTAYSKSSWERYLNGRATPPRQAVEALGQLSGADPVRLLALWELAEQGEPEPAPPPNVEAARVPRRRWLVVGGVVAVVLVLAAAVWWLTGGTPAPPTQPAVQPAGYACDYSTRDGHLYAGHSTTSSQLVMLNAGSQDVVEVQCLLKHHGLDPGRIDGMFGPHTEQAIEQLQRAGGAVVDGKVGPQTWALLRG